MKRFALALLALLATTIAADAGIITTSGGKCFGCASAGGGGGGTILTSLDYSLAATTTPNNGWTARSIGHTDMWTQSRQAGAGPQGQDCYRITQHFSETGVAGGDFPYGHGNSNLAVQGDGQSRFYRERLRYSASTDFNGREQEEPGDPEQVLRNKLLIVGDSSSVANSRVILQSYGEPASAGGPRWFLAVQIDANPTEAVTGYFTTLNVWHDLQWEIRYSSALNVADGYYKLWVDNNTYASPTAQELSIIVNRPDTQTLSLGYENNGVASGTQHEFDHCDFQVGTEFHSGWNQ